MFRKIAFGFGLALGLTGFILVGTGLFIYLLTGKIPFIEMQEGGRPAFKLLTPQELASLVKEQAKSLETKPLSESYERTRRLEERRTP